MELITKFMEQSQEVIDQNEKQKAIFDLLNGDEGLLTFITSLEDLPRIKEISPAVNSPEFKELQKLGITPKVLVIFDDMITIKNQRPIEEYFTMGRHHNVSSIYLTQKFHDTPDKIRNMCNIVSLFQSGGRELTQITQSLPEFDKEDIKYLYKKALEIPHCFVHLIRSVETRTKKEVADGYDPNKYRMRLGLDRAYVGGHFVWLKGNLTTKRIEEVNHQFDRRTYRLQWLKENN